MRIFITLCALLLLILNGCACAMENEMSESSGDVYAVMVSAQRKISNVLRVSPYGIGSAGGPKTGGFTSLGIDFKSYDKCFTEDEGRRLLINTLQMFIHEINTTAKIHSVLTPSPFEIKNVTITVFNQTPIPEKLGKIPYLEAVSIQRSKVQYFYILNNNEGYHSIVTETYEEALAILEMEKTNCTSTN